MRTSHIRTATAAGALCLLLAACSGGDSPETTAAPSASASETAAASPSPSASASASPTAAAVPRTAAQLRKALLTLSDLPAGFQKEKADGDDDGGVKAVSPKPGCAELVKIMNIDKIPGTVAEVTAGFSGGQAGPFVQESLTALPSASAADGFVTRFRKAVKGCSAVTVAIPGEGKVRVKVAEISFPELGDGTAAVRFSATDPQFEGLEFDLVVVQSADVIVGLTFFGAGGSDAQQFTRTAVDKVQETLGSTGTA